MEPANLPLVAFHPQPGSQLPPSAGSNGSMTQLKNFLREDQCGVVILSQEQSV
jgi:hypothetical protein